MAPRKKNTKLKTLIARSLIFGSLLSLSDTVHRAAHSLRNKSFFAGYERYEKVGKTSLCSTVTSFIRRKCNATRQWKLRLSASMEKGFFLPKLKSAVSSLMQLRMRSIGITLFLFGFLSAAMGLFKRYTLGMEDLSFLHIFSGPAIMLMAIPVILSRNELNNSLSESLILGRFLEVIGGVRQAELEFEPKTHKKNESLLIILGITLGLLTWWVAPLTLLLFIGAAILSAFILYKPEVGIVSIAFALPLLSHTWLIFAVVWTGFAYLGKLIRGKRVFHMEAIDYVALAFLILTLSSGFFSLAPTLSLPAALNRVVLIAIYFLAVNLLKSSAWVGRTVLMLFASSTLCAFLGLDQTFLSESAEVFTTDALRAVSTFDTGATFGSFLVLSLPLGFACLFTARYFRGKLWSFIALITLLGSLFFTLSRGSWFSLAVAMFLFFFIYSQKTLVVTGSAILSLPLWFALFPSFMTNFLLDFGAKVGSSIEYRSIVWQNSVQIFKDFWYCGIGTGDSLFTAVYPAYATTGQLASSSHHLFLQIAIEYGVLGLIVLLGFFLVFVQKIFTFIAHDPPRNLKLTATASLCGILALLLRGTTDYVWQDSRVFCMFWLIAAIGVATVNTAENEKTGGEIIQ